MSTRKSPIRLNSSHEPDSDPKTEKHFVASEQEIYPSMPLTRCKLEIILSTNADESTGTSGSSIPFFSSCVGRSAGPLASLVRVRLGMLGNGIGVVDIRGADPAASSAAGFCGVALGVSGLGFAIAARYLAGSGTGVCFTGGLTTAAA